MNTEHPISRLNEMLKNSECSEEEHQKTVRYFKALENANISFAFGNNMTFDELIKFIEEEG